MTSTTTRRRVLAGVAGGTIAAVAVPLPLVAAQPDAPPLRRVIAFAFEHFGLPSLVHDAQRIARGGAS